VTDPTGLLALAWGMMVAQDRIATKGETMRAWNPGRVDGGAAAIVGRRAWLAALLLAVAAVTVLIAPSAKAGGPSRWTDVTGNTRTNLTQVGLARSADGVLHIDWIRPAFVGYDVVTRAVSAGGALGAPVVVASGWSNLNNPDMAVRPDGSLIAFFDGQHTLDPQELNLGACYATAPADALAWTLGPGHLDSASGSAAYVSDVSGLVTPADVPLVTWYGTNGVYVHASFDASLPNYEFQSLLGPTAYYGYYSNLAIDGAGGQVWLAWASNATGKSGVWAARVDAASGAPVGEAVRMPGSVVRYSGSWWFSMMGSRTPVTGRPGRAGVWVAYPLGYPTTTKIALWRLGGTSTVTVASGAAAKGHAAVAAAPDGRVWVVWSQRNGERSRIYARVSNTTVTSFRPAVSVLTPAGYGDVYNIAASAQNGRVDIVAHLASATQERTWHTQLVPLR
jgi:hypothetical protein